MNTKTRMLMTLAAFVLTFGLITIGQSTSAQSVRGLFGPRGNSAQSSSAPSPNSNCKQIKGTETDLFDPIAFLNNGAVTNGGFLNGTTLWTYPPTGFVFTPDPNVVAFLADITITTVDGQLKTRVVISFNIVTGIGSAWGNIDPNASTGRFAGAAGVIFFDQYVPPPDINVGPYSGPITGQICFAQ